MLFRFKHGSPLTLLPIALLLFSARASAGETVQGALSGMAKAMNEYTERIFSKPGVDLVKAEAEIIRPAQLQMNQVVQEEFEASLKNNKVRLTDGSELGPLKPVDPNRVWPKRNLAGVSPPAQNLINGGSVGAPKIAPSAFQTDSPRRTEEAINGEQFPKSLVFQAKARTPEAGRAEPSSKASSLPVKDAFQGKGHVTR